VNAEDIDGPGPEWYREAMERDGTPWPPPRSFTRAEHARLTPRARADGTWPCPRCGGPAVLPDLASTLPYRQCGYAQTPAGTWVHK
jgi:hypothetical protein